MEVMHRAIVKSRSLKPLPGEITNQRINDATLPVKIEAARRAIAECTDLPELLRYKNEAEAIAAAVRILHDVAPEIIAQANRMVKEGILRLGELLSQYNGSNRIEGAGKTRKVHPSERTLVADQHKLKGPIIHQSVKVASAKKELRERVLIDASVRPTAAAMATAVTPPPKRYRSNAYNRLMKGGCSDHRSNWDTGLLRVRDILKSLDPNDATYLVNTSGHDSELKFVREVVLSITESIDLLAQRLKL